MDKSPVSDRELLQLGLQHTTDLIQYVNVDEDRLAFHGDIDSLLGYEPGEFPRTVGGWIEMIHPDDRARISETVERVMAEERPGWSIRYRIKAGDGTYRHWLDRGTLTAPSRGEGIGGIIDETEQVRARLELEETLRKISEHAALSDTVLSSMRDSAAVLDAEGRIVAVNEAWLRFARENGAESDSKIGVGANYLEVCEQSSKDDPYAASVLEGIQSVLRGTESTFQIAYPCHSATHQRWFSMTVAGGAKEGFAVVFHSQLKDLLDSQKELEAQISSIQELSQRLVAESDYLRVEIDALHDTEEVAGSSDAMKRVLDQAELVATTGATVLLTGETGVGKELLARRIHAHSARHERILIKVDCGALPAGLVESELFGHEKGAFTGAHKAKPGRFELAHRGTIFLDEVGELPIEAQTKLLRVLEDGRLQRLGSLAEKKVDVRIIAATNRDLRQDMRDGRFREDLFYRLSVFPIEVPPLRERPEDIPPLVELFAKKYSKAIGRRVDRMPRSCMDTLVAYDWPGNVRELRNVVERSVILCQDGALRVDGLTVGSPRVSDVETSGSLERDLRAVERARIMRALEAANWRIKGEGNAASQLGLSPSGVRSKMKRLGITRPE